MSESNRDSSLPVFIAGVLLGWAASALMRSVGSRSPAAPSPGAAPPPPAGLPDVLSRTLGHMRTDLFSVIGTVAPASTRPENKAEQLNRLRNEAVDTLWGIYRALNNQPGGNERYGGQMSEILTKIREISVLADQALLESGDLDAALSTVEAQTTSLNAAAAAIKNLTQVLTNLNAALGAADKIISVYPKL